MGDTGSLTIGLLLCFLAIRMSQMGASVRDVNPVILAFVPLFIPCMDVVRVFIGRIRRGANPFKPDQTHIHHKLMKTGLSQRLTMVIILVSSALFIVFNVMLSASLNVNLILLLDVFLWCGFNVFLSKIARNNSLK